MIKSHFDHKLLNPVSSAKNTRKHLMDTWTAMESLLEEDMGREERHRYHEWPSEKVYTIGRDEDSYLDEGCPD